MLMAFELGMPSVASWNGKWSGEDRLHVKVLRFGKNTKVKPGYHTYQFGDGWRASVTVREVDSATARQLRRKSAGFCGYDWMIDEIIEYGTIREEGDK